MPIPMQPFTFHCPSCHWQQTVTPRSDALRAGVDWFSECPRCHSRSLQRRPASSIEVLAVRVRTLGRLMR